MENKSTVKTLDNSQLKEVVGGAKTPSKKAPSKAAKKAPADKIKKLK